MKRDIENRDDIQLFVTEFYEEARKDQLLGSVFFAAVKDEEWPSHIERIVDFWDSVLFYAQSYKGSAFSVHKNLPIEERHFTRWLELFGEALDRNFSGEVADDVKDRAQKMGTMFSAKLEYLRSNPDFINLQ